MTSLMTRIALPLNREAEKLENVNLAWSISISKYLSWHFSLRRVADHAPSSERPFEGKTHSGFSTNVRLE